MSSWRDRYRLIIAATIATSQAAGHNRRELRRELRKVCPLTERKYWPYKIWLDEIRRQLQPGARPELRAQAARKPQPPDPRQPMLFEEPTE